MGKKNLTIGEISEILNITPSTLRFWGKGEPLSCQQKE